jgi:hypothetical protein
MDLFAVPFMLGDLRIPDGIVGSITCTLDTYGDRHIELNNNYVNKFSYSS